MCAYSSIKPVDKCVENISVGLANLIDYIVKQRIVDSVKTLVEQNHTVEHIATLANVTLDEADWLTWFVQINKDNMKLWISIV